jgi:hypothetical protein
MLERGRDVAFDQAAPAVMHYGSTGTPEPAGH